VVSTVNLFHTILATAGISQDDIDETERETIAQLNLGNQPTANVPVFSEAYAPFNLILILEKYAPDLIARFHCRDTHWAVYDQAYKMIRVENQYDAIFNYSDDPREQRDLYPNFSSAPDFAEKLDNFLEYAKYKAADSHLASAGSIEDEAVLQRLRNLGYIE
jgi:spore maturation protein CgeB